MNHPKSLKTFSVTYKILQNFPVFQLGNKQWGNDDEDLSRKLSSVIHSAVNLMHLSRPKEESRGVTVSNRSPTQMNEQVFFDRFLKIFFV